MNVPASQAVLDLSARRLPALERFGAGLQALTFAQLVAIVGRLDRSREHLRRVQASASQTPGLEPEFLANLGDLATQTEAEFALVEAELERRLPVRPADTARG